MATATRKRIDVADSARELTQAFKENRTLTYASALSFQLVTAVVPALLFGLALIGFLDLQGVWKDIAANIKPHMSKPAFSVVQDTAGKVLTQKQLWWLTFGFALAVWEISGGIRTIMGGLCEIYELNESRSWFARMRRSLALALAVGALVLLAIAIAWGGPLLYGDAGQPLGALLFLVRWGICGCVLATATALTVRFAPDGYQPTGWVTTGTAIVVGAWILASIAFGLYVRYVASYGSLFGNLATLVILFAYIYISAIVFFAGAQVDAIIRERVEGNPQGR